ncbi:uncharacterized protein MELLADRAFT_113506 [Melampsora larici-populina 98AG31]|uniref:Uncharacterized protein n=1 Tax=Melampsora larici-populina (strain 98AG31 / pathotype 3-4-7) TaxID=747676 RepID=F4SA48_MELLP|nr:uncharacterized protein MELLADRAFT_113506 [Melampsora larici-populina 98AG31]EGF98502.1 hypothetical protein MELLADRAFT_113506 [Melampsora larici-populina 98AG31]
MASSNITAQSTAFQRTDGTEDRISSHPFIGPGVLDLVRFTTEKDAGNDSTRSSKKPEDQLSEKLKEMEIQKTSLASRIPTREKKHSVTPYYRKPKFVRARAPEAPREHKRQRNPAVIVDLKELNKMGSGKHTE